MSLKSLKKQYFVDFVKDTIPSLTTEWVAKAEWCYLCLLREEQDGLFYWSHNNIKRCACLNCTQCTDSPASFPLTKSYVKQFSHNPLHRLTSEHRLDRNSSSKLVQAMSQILHIVWTKESLEDSCGCTVLNTARRNSRWSHAGLDVRP